MSFQIVKRTAFSIFILFGASLFIFFVIGFIYYTPPQPQPLYDSITMPVILFTDESDLDFDNIDREKKTEGREENHISSITENFPPVHERPGKVKVATEYARLLSQMSSILEDMGSVKTLVALEDCGEGFAGRYESVVADEGILSVPTIEEIMRQRMVTIEDVLEYVSSQIGISTDLLAAVAWAESKMLPYAINVRGKAYYFTSREQALKALDEFKTDEVDIGLFQVNYPLWGAPLRLKKENLLDTRVCAIIAAMILKYNLQRHRDPWVAIGRYHSGDIDRMKAYQTKVSRGLVIIRKLSVTSLPSEGPASSRMYQGIPRNPAIPDGALDS
ncbi:MAG: transglycosylase SLT domain-containing protein [Deltaproteobacteria bacterium]|nr:transglycosylase SLT domain-containing protein [Deltaproteobacteria bacterium]